VKFHIKQGLLLLIIEIALWILSMLLWMLWPLWQVLNVIVIIFAIIGIVNAVKGIEKDLPFIGKYGSQLKF
jgi:uncharacterized membrane protein